MFIVLYENEHIFSDGTVSCFFTECGKTFIVTRAIMSDIRELQGYAVFYS